MKYLLKIFICASLFFCAKTSTAQVTAVQYSLVYNSFTKSFDCFLHIEEGDASLMRERIQFNSQISIVVPTGSKVNIQKTYMPLIENQAFNGEQPIKWSVTSKLVSPEIMPNVDLYGITPSLAPAGFYNKLRPGDKIKLFSVSVKGKDMTEGQVRIFDNDNDPKSNGLGMQNGDFSNGFTMGGFTQLYKGNKKVSHEHKSPSGLPKKNN